LWYRFSTREVRFFSENPWLFSLTWIYQVSRRCAFFLTIEVVFKVIITPFISHWVAYLRSGWQFLSFQFRILSPEYGVSR